MAKKKIYAAANRLTVRDLFFTFAGVASACFGLEGFLLPSGFLDGGVVGLSIIAQKVTMLPLPFLIFFINVPFIMLSYFSISRVFALKSTLGIGLLAIALNFVHIPEMTTDPLLVAVFGGFFIGMGIGLAIRGGSVLDGTEVLGLYLSKHSPLSVADVILSINVLIFLGAMFVFSLETALYAMLTYMSASRTIDFVLHGIEEYTAVKIISNHNAALHRVITNELKLEVTVLHGQRGAPNAKADKARKIDILYTVVSRLDLPRLLNAVEILDPEATLIYHPVTDVYSSST